MTVAEKLAVVRVLGRIRGAPEKGALLNPLLALLNRDLMERVYIPRGPRNPIPKP